MGAARTGAATAAARPRRLKSSGRSWTPDERREVVRIIAECRAEGKPLTAAFKRVTEAMPHRTQAAVAMLYYNVLRQDGEASRATPSPGESPEATPSRAGNGTMRTSARPFEITSDIVEAFEGLPEYMARLHRRIDEVEKRLDLLPRPSLQSLSAWMAEMAQALRAASEGEARIEALLAELSAVRAERDRLAAELDRMTGRLEEIESAYREAHDLYEMFTNMASISQIMTLGDFKQRMRTTLDRWGNVLKVDFEPVSARAPLAPASRPTSAPG